ncbi:MAG TPA: hypothetical protein VLB44_23040 [Kofleriaceae bacterium]|nr:hypothetical protein [Kofleriaceae bacterium]
MGSAAPLGREHAMALVEKGSLPIAFGSQPTVVVVEQDGKFRIRELVIDRAEAEAAAAAATRSRTPSWMPEHFYALGKPTGRIFAEAESRAALLEVMRTMSWPENW